MSHIYDSLCFFAMWNGAFEGCTFRISAVIWFSSKITSQRKKMKKSPNQARFIFDAVSRRNYYLLLKHMLLHFSGPIRKSKWSFEQKKLASVMLVTTFLVTSPNDVWHPESESQIHSSSQQIICIDLWAFVLLKKTNIRKMYYSQSKISVTSY